MIKNMAWNVFKNTGNIDTFLEFKQIKDIENGNASEIVGNSNLINGVTMQNNGIVPTIQKVELDGINKNEWNNNF